MRKNQAHSELTIHKMKSSSKSKPVVQLSKNLDYVNEYASILDASRVTGINDIGIRNCLNIRNISRTAGGFVWGYQSDFSQSGLDRLKTLKNQGL